MRGTETGGRVLRAFLNPMAITLAEAGQWDIAVVTLQMLTPGLVLRID